MKEIWVVLIFAVLAFFAPIVLFLWAAANMQRIDEWAHRHPVEIVVALGSLVTGVQLWRYRRGIKFLWDHFVRKWKQLWK